MSERPLPATPSCAASDITSSNIGKSFAEAASSVLLCSSFQHTEFAFIHVRHRCCSLQDFQTFETLRIVGRHELRRRRRSANSCYRQKDSQSCFRMLRMKKLWGRGFHLHSSGNGPAQARALNEHTSTRAFADASFDVREAALLKPYRARRNTKLLIPASWIFGRERS